jgi:ribosome recycling factor
LPRAAVRLQEDEEADPERVVMEAEEKMKKTISNTMEQLSTLRVGRANPSLLDRVQVDYYGAPTPLNQLASVSAPTASQLVVDPYDKSAIGDVERALFESDLGMTPNNDGQVIRLNVPQLTEERRKELGTSRSTAPCPVRWMAHPPARGSARPRSGMALTPTHLVRPPAAKTAKSLGEDGKVALRNIRKGAIDKIKKMKKAIGEDAVKDGEIDVQEAIKKYEDEVVALVTQREKEIMTV